MDKVRLSKSKYCKCVQCEKILWLERYCPEYSPEAKNDSVFEKGRQVGELAKGLFGDYTDIPTDEDIGVRLKQTDKLLREGASVITEASFSYDSNFCSVDILRNCTDGVEIYEVKSSTKIKDIYVDDVAYQYFVLSNLGLNVKKACIVYINNEYVKMGDLDIGQLFNVEDVTETVRQMQAQITDNIDSINGFMEKYADGSEPDTDIGPHCFSPYECSFWDYCIRNLVKPNVFDISGMYKSKKFEKYYEGKISFEELSNEKLNPKYLEQIDFELNRREAKINRKAIRDVLDSLRYPLYFIDYETCQYAVPEYDGTKAYQQIPFQYSLHIIEKEGAPLMHKEYLARHDDEDIIMNFALSMIGDLPENGSVIVYNKSFEAGRNREIARMYPDLKSEIERINANMVDLMVPFKNRDYYTREMKGSYSIKYVLPALYPDDPELDYSELTMVHKGDEASDAFLSLKDKSDDEREEIRKALLEYCRLDTYAMVKIWEKFKEALQ